MPRYDYTLRNVGPLPHQQQAGPPVCGATRTLEEAIAIVREAVEEGHKWEWYEITAAGLRWWWEPVGMRSTMKFDRVDRRPVS